ncbi:MAG: alpha/beta fold hydrolase [Stellaceae bacterium]
MKIRGKTLEVEQQGDGDAVLMVHGLGGTSNTWYAQRAVLARSFKVICPDLDGSGRSPTSGSLSIEEFVADMVALLDALAVKAAHLVGHSMGTIVCQHLASSYPDRVSSLALIGPLAEPPEPARKGLRDRAAAARETGMAAIADTMLPLSTSAETRASRLAAAAMVRELLMRQSAEGYAKTCEALAAARAAELGRIKCPTILITGDEDGVGPPAAVKRLAQRIAGAKTVILGGTGHWTPIERPREVNEALLNFYFGGATGSGSR